MHDHPHPTSTGLRTAFLLNFSFTILEIFGAWWTNSFAILADALHDLGDSLSLGLALYLHRLAQRQADQHFTYGYRRFSPLGALTTALVLVVGLTLVCWHAVERLAQPPPVSTPGMLVLAVLGILVNGAAVLRTRHGTSLSERMVSWHLLEDVLGWAAVLVGAVIMSIWNVPVIDPLLSLGISVFICWNVVRNLRQVGAVFLQRAPAGFDPQKFREQAESLPGIAAAQDVHTWTLDGEHHVLSAHLTLAPGATPEQQEEAKRALREGLRESDFEHVTIETTPAGTPCCGCHGDSHAPHF